LMMEPNVPKRQWFATSVDVSEKTPLIEVQAMFEPSTPELDGTVRENEGEDAIEMATERDTNGQSTTGGDDATDHGSISTDNETVSLAQQTLQSSIGESLVHDRLHNDAMSYLSSPTRRKRVLVAKQHLLQVTTFRTPANCCICGNSLMSGPLLVWKRLALRCEECKVDCCEDCRLRVDIQLPCGSELAKRAVSEAIQSRLSLEKLLSVIAPVEDISKLANFKSAAGSLPKAPIDAASVGTERGIGALKLNFVRAHVWAEPLPADFDSSTLVSEDSGKERRLRPGDYYIRVTQSGSDKSVRTPTIQQSNGRPTLEYGEMRFLVYVLLVLVLGVVADFEAVLTRQLCLQTGPTMERNFALS
jgi:hypothetical protein